MSDAVPILAYEGVTRRYAPGAAPAVDDVSLAVTPGSFVALVGASGSGKSSLLRMANALDRPDAGRVRRDGADVAALDPVALRRATGFVFQNVGLFPHFSIAENVAIGPRLAGAPPPDIGAALDRVGLPARYAARLPAQLSGGEQQRVGIARALAGKAKLLLMDEPFGALDPVTREALGRTVRTLHAELGLTTVLVTHDMAEALLLATRIVVMDHGRIAADASPRDMLAGAAGPQATALVAVAERQAALLAELRR